MTKVALIGAGSAVFTRDLVNDLLTFPSLEDATISVMDIDPGRLKLAHDLVCTIIRERGAPARVEATLDRSEAIRDANYVVVTVQVGGLDAYAQDILIPQRYGVEQCVGDTTGPGGVFRALRTIPVLLDLCADMDELCAPDALLINYSNPMAMLCWAIGSTGRPFIGLCHSVQGTTQLLASWAGVPYEDVVYRGAGINHLAWILRIEANGQDLYPIIRKRVDDPEILGSEPVRIELFKHFGYFVTESSGHASEYNPYFRRDRQMVERLTSRFTSAHDEWFKWGQTGGYLTHSRETLPTYLDEVADQAAGKQSALSERSSEYCAWIIDAMETNRPYKFNGNVINRGLITNLPDGCCVEVPCLVDGNGIQPTVVGDLPPQLAALDRTMINVQSLAVHAALHGCRESVYQALMLDPLTASVVPLDRIRSMADEMIEAERAWLPTLA